MSKLTIGVVAGVALAAAVAVPSLAASGSSDITLNTGSTTAARGVPAGATATPAPAGKVAVKAGAVSVAAVRTTTKAVPLPRVLTVVRSVRLTLPTSTKVGSTITGYIQVMDSNGQVSSPVPGVSVALQQKTAGTAKYMDVATDVTDAGGQVNVAFTCKANTTWRAVLKPATGKLVYSTTVFTTVSAQLTWAARPDMDVARKVSTSYAFRVSPVGGSGRLEMANSKTPTKWIPAPKKMTVPPNGVITQSIAFPTAGTWLVRGATTASATNAAGYTTTLTVVVS